MDELSASFWPPAPVAIAVEAIETVAIVILFLSGSAIAIRGKTGFLTHHGYSVYTLS
ncbi:MAG: hypothetical protein Q7T78_24375 [Rhodoferax sp.]|nr:hypothetical protein [Rhodoferax sp.]